MSANLGKIAITIGGDHVISNTYERLTIVKSSTDVWYLSLWDVPANIALTDQGYWVVFFDPAMNAQQVADNAQDIVTLFNTLSGVIDVPNGLTIKNGSNRAKIVDNGLYLFSQHGTLDERKMQFNKYDSGDGFDIQLLDKDNNAIGDSLNFDGLVWKVGGSEILTDSAVDVLNAVNKIVKRDSAGDVQCRLVRPEFTSGSSNSNYFVVQHAIGTTASGADNFMRTRTYVQIKADLGVRSYTYQKRGELGGEGTYYIYPPTGYTMSHLTACSFWASSLHMNSSALNSDLTVTYESTRIKVVSGTYRYGTAYYTAWEKV